MMSQERITYNDVKQALENHKDALDALGIVIDGTLLVSQGSKTYGNAYRIYRTCVDVGAPDGRLSTGHFPPPVGDDYLGMTAREAYETLTNRTRVLWDVAAIQRGRG